MMICARNCSTNERTQQLFYCALSSIVLCVLSSSWTRLLLGPPGFKIPTQELKNAPGELLVGRRLFVQGFGAGRVTAFNRVCECCHSPSPLYLHSCLRCGLRKTPRAAPGW